VCAARSSLTATDTRRQTVTLIRYPPPRMLSSLALPAAAWVDSGSFGTETPLRRRRLSCSALSGSRRGRATVPGTGAIAPPGPVPCSGVYRPWAINSLEEGGWLKIVPAAADSNALSGTERLRGRASTRPRSKRWQRDSTVIGTFRISVVAKMNLVPVILTNVACAPSCTEAHERAMQYLGVKWDSIDAHYSLSDGHLTSLKGYDSFGKMQKIYGMMKDLPLGKRTDFNVGIQIVGKADDCIQQPGELQRLTGTDLVCGFSYSRMLSDKAELNMRLFAERAEREAARRRVCGGVGASKCHIVAVPACSCSIRTHGSTPFAAGGLAAQVDGHRKTAYFEQGEPATK
jgi:hypothetical protein